MSTEHLKTISVLIVEDHDKVRAAVRSILESADGIEVIAEAAEQQDAIELAEKARPDVMVLDVDVAVISGEVEVGSLLERLPDTHVLVLTAFDDAEYVQGFVESGAAGCLLKDDVPDLLVEAVRTIQEGPNQAWISPRLIA